MNKEELLARLRIERDPAQPASSTDAVWWSGRRRLIIALIAALAVAGGSIWLWSRSPTAPLVDVATAQALGGSQGGFALLEASGYVVARREATVSSKVTGRVIEVLIEEGQQVTAGQVIARLDASNVAAMLGQAEAEISTAQANADLARVNEASTRQRLARFEELGSAGWLSPQALEDVRAAHASARTSSELARRQIAVARASRSVIQRSLDDTIVRAPFAGVVTERAAQVGEIVSPISAGGGFTRTGICTIVDMHSLEVEVDVAESQINRVSPGMPARVTLNAYPDWAIPAEVAAVIPTGDRSRATVKVRIRFSVEDSRIIPEMGAKVSFLNPAAAESSVTVGSVEVPVQAIMPAPGGGYVAFVVGDDLELERRPVRLGERRGEQQTVLGGISSGERVVIGGLARLRDGMSVRTNDN